jgi:hypothetical protein
MSTAKKDETAAEATHYVVAVPCGPYAAGEVVPSEDLHAALGADPKAKDEAVASTRTARVKQLLQAGVIAPTAAPPDPEEVAKEAAEKAEADRVAEEKAEADASKKAPPPSTEPPKSAPHPPHGRPEPPKR